MVRPARIACRAGRGRGSSRTLIAQATRSAPGARRAGKPDVVCTGRYARRARLAFAAVLMLAALATAAPAFAEMQQTVRLDLYNVVSGDAAGGPWTFGGAGKARLDFRSTGNRMVQGRLVVDAAVSDAPLTFFDISRASVRFRFPVGEEYMFRVTAGKERLSWGDGVYFNAGDLIFGSSTERADFIGETLRDETAWLLSGYFPMGQFSFFEAVLLPPQTFAYEMDPAVFADPDTFMSTMAAALLPGGDISETAGGFRFQFKPGQLKVEPGYLFKGKTNTHNPYLSLQGHLLADWYISASTALDGNAADGEALADSAWEGFTLSFGLLHIARPGRDSTLSLRLEGLLRPGAEHQLLLFPELLFSPSSTVNTWLRSEISMEDFSAMVIPGVSWNVFQGFSMLANASVQLGEGGSRFSWDNQRAFALTTGVSYIY
jgi:hypothetical protein